jgi:putative transposase
MIAFIDAHRAVHGVEPICRVPPIAPSTYHAHVARRADPAKGSAWLRRDARLRVEIRRVFDENYGVYGVRKVWRQLGRVGIAVARCTVERLMRRMGLRGAVRGRGARTTIADKAAPRPADKVNRQFRASHPNALWVSDFTYVATWQGFVYVAFVIDVFARRIVGWRVSRTAHAGFVLDALEQALHDRRPRKGGLIHHSDRGGQYVAIRHTERLLEAGIEPSVGSVGDSYDNARARRDRHRPVRDRGDPATWPLARHGSRRVRHPRLGRLVQQPPPPRADRQHPARRGGGALPCCPGGDCAGGVTQAKRPPAKPGRFNAGRRRPPE